METPSKSTINATGGASFLMTRDYPGLSPKPTASPAGTPKKRELHEEDIVNIAVQLVLIGGFIVCFAFCAILLFHEEIARMCNPEIKYNELIEQWHKDRIEEGLEPPRRYSMKTNIAKERCK